jgi:tetratricopeptide (TPR) repeat protein
VLEASYEHGRAFYDFFQVHELKDLDETETFALLRHLADRDNSAPVKRILEADPARVRALRLLTGGNPRTIALLFRVFERENANDTGDATDNLAMSDLEELLDLHTPLYKARFEELPEQAQRVVDAMAIHWDPITAGGLGELMDLKVNLVSAQLERLASLGVVEKVQWFGEKKTGFQIAERFFNIWYLMRASRRVRRGLVWYVKFLATFFRADELRARAEKLLCDTESARANPERHAALSLAYAQEGGFGERLRGRLEHEGLRVAMAAPDRIRELIDFRDLAPALLDKKARMERMRALAAAAPTARADWGDVGPQEFWQFLATSPRYSVEEKARIVESLAKLDLAEIRKLRDQWKYSRYKLHEMYRLEQSSVDRLEEALASGEMEDAFDWETAVAIENGPVLANIALNARFNSYLAKPSEGDIRRAEQAALAMSEHPDLAARARNTLGNLLQDHLGRYDEAEAAYRRAIELDPQVAVPWYNFGNLLKDHLGRYEESETAYRRAIEIDPQFAYPWNNLGILLQDHLGRHEEAEAAYRRAIEIDPQSAYPWNNLGNLFKNHLRRYEEAEAVYRRAIELDPQSANHWNNLGNLCKDQLNRYEEAEAAYRRAIELDPQFVYPWSNLGLLLASQSKPKDAARTLLHAVELDPKRTYDQIRLRSSVRLLPPNAATLELAQAAAKALPQDIETQLLPAEILLAQKQWHAAAEMLRPVAANPESPADSFNEVARAAVASRFTTELRKLLEETGAYERWRPLYEALRAIEAGTEDYLRRVSPEVRYVAEKLYRRFRQPGEESR